MKTLRPITSTFTRTLSQPPSTSTYTCRAASLTRPTNHNRHPHLNQRRTFLANPFASTTPQTITATRTLPYSKTQIFSVITDISSYSTFYPFCLESTVTKYSSPTSSNGQKYPEEAKLVVGWQDTAREEFWSRIYCVPERIVEAVSGRAETSLSVQDIEHHSPRSSSGSEDPTRRDGVVEHLLTRWTLRPSKGKEKEQTEVHLRIELQFANPFYAALSQAAVPKVAEKMIEAFEKRVGEVVRQRRINDE